MWKATDSAGEHALEVGGRLDAAPAELMSRTAFAAELNAQSGLVAEVGLADLAHTIVLVEAGVIPKAEGAALLTALLELQREPDALELDPAHGDVYTNREAWLRSRTAAVGWLGAGRARREAVTVGHHLALRDRLLALGMALHDAATALAQRAREERHAVMCDYTYLQPAHATSFGHYLLGFATPMLRDLDRLRSALERVDRSPAGGGSCAGSRIPQDRDRLAELLGFSGVIPHMRDAMWQADAQIELGALATAALINLDRLAEDLMFFASGEIGLVRLDDVHSRASKVMPQKRNPYALSYIRALANRAIGTLAALAASGRTPSGQMDNRLLAYQELPRLLEDTAEAARLMAAVVQALEFDRERAAAAVQRFFVSASDLAEVLTMEGGLDYRAAHRLVGRLAAELERSRRLPGQVVMADILAAAAAAEVPAPVLSEAALRGALDPEQGVSRRCAPARVAALAEDLAGALAGHRARIESAAARVGHARDALLARAQSLGAA